MNLFMSQVCVTLKIIPQEEKLTRIRKNNSGYKERCAGGSIVKVNAKMKAPKCDNLL